MSAQDQPNSTRRDQASVDATPLGDAELVRLARRDRAHYRLIMDRFGPRLYKFAYTRLSDNEEALDVVQETFLSAWQALGRYDETRELAPWLYRIALNKCRDSLRRRRARRVLSFFGDLAPGTAEHFADDKPAADLVMQRDAMNASLHLAIGDLPQRLREPLILTMWEGFSYRDAALILGTDEKAVENSLYRARKRLANQLKAADVLPLLGDLQRI